MLGGGFATPPQLGEFVADEAELLGEVVSVGAVSAELLLADSVLTECSPVGLVEDVAWQAAGAGVTVWVLEVRPDAARAGGVARGWGAGRIVRRPQSPGDIKSDY